MMNKKEKKALISILGILIAAVLGYFGISFDGAGNGRENVSGRVARVIDGDTYDLLLDDNTTVRIRMDGIDAPERGQPHAQRATDYLKELTENQIISVSLKNKDRYGRIISFSRLADGRELGAEMIKAGYAWHYKQYNNDRQLARLENEARKARRGLWQDNDPIAPWDWRRQ